MGLQHIEHSGNPLGDLSMPRGFGRTRQKQKLLIVAFFILATSSHPCPSHIYLLDDDYYMGIFALTFAG